MRKTHARLYVRTRQDPCPRAYACSALLGPSSGALAAPHRMAASAYPSPWSDGEWRLMWVDCEVDDNQALQGLQAQSSTSSTIEHSKATQDFQAQSSTTKWSKHIEPNQALQGLEGVSDEGCPDAAAVAGQPVPSQQYSPRQAHLEEQAKHDQALPEEQRFGNHPATRHGVSEKGDQPGASMRGPWLLDAQRLDRSMRNDLEGRNYYMGIAEMNRRLWRDAVSSHIREKFTHRTQSLLDDVGVHEPVRGDGRVPFDADPAYVRTYVP